MVGDPLAEPAPLVGEQLGDEVVVVRDLFLAQTPAGNHGAGGFAVLHGLLEGGQVVLAHGLLVDPHGGAGVQVFLIIQSAVLDVYVGTLALSAGDGSSSHVTVQDRILRVVFLGAACKLGTVGVRAGAPPAAGAGNALLEVELTADLTHAADQLGVEGRSLQRSIRPGEGRAQVQGTVSVGVLLLADGSDGRGSAAPQAGHFVIGQLVHEVVPGVLSAVDDDGAVQGHASHLIQLNLGLAVDAVSVDGGRILLGPVLGDGFHIPGMLGAVDAAGLIGNDLAVEAVEVVGRVHVQNLLLTVDSSLVEDQVSVGRGLREGAFHVSTGQDGHARFGIGVERAGADGVVDGFGIGEQSGHFVAGEGILHEVGYSAFDGEGSVIIGAHALRTQHAGVGHGTEHILAGIQFPTSMAVGIGVVIVEGSNILHVNLDDDHVGLAGLEQFGLAEANQLDEGLLNLALVVGSGQVDLHALLAFHVASVGHGHGDVDLGSVSLLLNGGSEDAAVDLAFNSLGTGSVGVDTAHVEGEVSVGQAEAEGVHNVEIMPGVSDGLIFRGILAFSQRGVALSDFVPEGLVVLVAQVDALFVFHAADTAGTGGAGIDGQVLAVLIGIAVHIVAGDIFAVSAEAELTAGAGVSPGGIGGEVTHILSRSAAGGGDHAAEDLGHSRHASLVDARTAEPQHGVDLRILLQVVHFEGVGGVEDNQHLFEVGLCEINQSDFGVGQLQCMLDFHIVHHAVAIHVNSRHFAFLGGGLSGMSVP